MHIVKARRKTVTVLGATGSIGKHTARLIASTPDAFKVKALTAKSNVKALAVLAKNLNAEEAVIANPACYNDLKEALSGTGIKVSAGDEAIIEAAGKKADVVVSGMVGATGLRPTLAAIRQGTTVAFANKECLVCAGSFMMEEVKKYRANLIPVDSEHNAVFQVFDFKNKNQVSNITLTASGGPFRDCTIEQMQHVTPKEAIAHPNWEMGAKISVDSATMINKGLEIIEAYHLFPVKSEQIDVVIHPESIIHSMVQYVDGSILAQMGNPDMSIPISYALAWPERMKGLEKTLSLAEIGKLTFRPVDHKRFPAIQLAHEVLREGGAAPIIFNAANEIAVAHFLGNRIRFLDIFSLVRQALDTIKRQPIQTMDDVFSMIQLVHQETENLSTNFYKKAA